MAKITPEQAIKTIMTEHSYYNDDRARIEVEPEWQQVIDCIESQAREAELGRAAVEAIKGHPAKFTTTICLKLPPEITEKYCGSPVCMWHEFCRLRAEIDRLQRAGVE